MNCQIKNMWTDTAMSAGNIILRAYASQSPREMARSSVGVLRINSKAPVCLSSANR